MQAEWIVECGGEDPVLVVPWNSAGELSTAAGYGAFVDLRANPAAIDTIPEAEAHPPLMRALRALNTARSPVFTAKCDAWEMDAGELARLKLEMGIAAHSEIAEEAAPDAHGNSESDTLTFGFASYIDCIVRDRALFASFPRQEHLLRSITRVVAQLDHPHAGFECVLRPAFVHLDAPQQGYAVSVYVKAMDESPQRAWKRWAAALADVTALLRRSDIVR